jgi:hypothetical protein
VTTRIIENPISIFERAVILKLSIGRPGNRRQIDQDKITVDADKSMVHAHKDLLDSVEFNKIKTRQDRLRTDIKKLALPSPLGAGTYLISVDGIERVEDLFFACQDEISEKLLPAMREAYPERVSESKRRLNGLADPTDYPPVEDFLSSFYISTQYVSFGAPDALAKVRPDLLDREKNKIESATMESISSIFSLLRLDMKDLVDKLVVRAGRAQDGEKTKFKGLLDNLTEFLDNLPMRANVIDATELTTLGSKAKSILQGVDSEALRTDKRTRDYVTQAFTEIQGNLEKMTLRPTRAFEAA